MWTVQTHALDASMHYMCAAQFLVPQHVVCRTFSAYHTTFSITSQLGADDLKDWARLDTRGDSRCGITRGKPQDPAGCLPEPTILRRHQEGIPGEAVCQCP